MSVIRPLSTQDTNISSGLPVGGGKNITKKASIFTNTPKASHKTSFGFSMTAAGNNKQLRQARVVSTPVSSIKSRQLKMPLIDQLSLTPGSDVDNDPFQQFNNKKTQRFDVFGLKKFHLQSSSSSPLASAENSFADYSMDQRDQSFLSSFSRDNDDNNDDGRDVLANAAAIFEAKLEELQDKENIPPVGTPRYPRRQREFEFDDSSFSGTSPSSLSSGEDEDDYELEDYGFYDHDDSMDLGTPIFRQEVKKKKVSSFQVLATSSPQKKPSHSFQHNTNAFVTPYKKPSAHQRHHGLLYSNLKKRQPLRVLAISPAKKIGHSSFENHMNISSTPRNNKAPKTPRAGNLRRRASVKRTPSNNEYSTPILMAVNTNFDFADDEAIEEEQEEEEDDDDTDNAGNFVYLDSQLVGEGNGSNDGIDFDFDSMPDLDAIENQTVNNNNNNNNNINNTTATNAPASRVLVRESNATVSRGTATATTNTVRREVGRSLHMKSNNVAGSTQTTMAKPKQKGFTVSMDKEANGGKPKTGSNTTTTNTNKPFKVIGSGNGVNMNSLANSSSLLMKSHVSNPTNSRKKVVTGTNNKRMVFMR